MHTSSNMNSTNYNLCTNKKFFQTTAGCLNTTNIHGKRNEDFKSLAISEYQKLKYLFYYRFKYAREFFNKNEQKIIDLQNNKSSEITASLSEFSNYINTTGENTLNEEDLEAIGLITTNNLEVCFNTLVKDILNDENKKKQLNNYLEKYPESPFKKIQKFISKKNPNEDISPEEFETLISKIKDDANNKQYLKIIENLTNGYLSPILDEKIQDHIEYAVLGLFFCFSLLIIANILWDPKEYKKGLEIEVTLCNNQFKNENNAIEKSQQECQTKHNNLKTKIEKNKEQQIPSMKENLITHFRSTVNGNITNIKILDINGKTDEIESKIVSIPNYDPTLKVKKHETLTTNSAENKLVNDPYRTVPIAQFASEIIFFGLNNVFPAYRVFSTPSISDTHLLSFVKVAIHEIVPMVMISNGKYGQNEDEASNKNYEDANKLLTENKNQINEESTNKAKEFTEEIEKGYEENNKKLLNYSPENNKKVLEFTIPNINGEDLNFESQKSIAQFNNAQNTDPGNNGNKHTFIPFADSISNSNTYCKFISGGDTFGISEDNFIWTQGSGSVIGIENNEDTPEHIISIEIDKTLYIKKTFSKDSNIEIKRYSIDTENKHIIAKHENGQIFFYLSGETIFGKKGNLMNYIHKVKEGDTIYKIAKDHGIKNQEGNPDIELIKKINNLSEEENGDILIYPNDEIKIPIMLNSNTQEINWSTSQINDASQLTNENKVLWDDITQNNAPTFTNTLTVSNGGFYNGVTIANKTSETEIKVFADINSFTLDFLRNETLIESSLEVSAYQCAGFNPINRISPEDGTPIGKNHYENKSENINSKCFTLFLLVFFICAGNIIQKMFIKKNAKTEARIIANQKLNAWLNAQKNLSINNNSDSDSDSDSNSEISEEKKPYDNIITTNSNLETKVEMAEE